MRFGLDVAQQRMPWDELVRRVQLAEQLGFDGAAAEAPELAPYVLRRDAAARVEAGELQCRAPEHERTADHHEHHTEEGHGPIVGAPWQRNHHGLAMSLPDLANVR